MSHSELLNALLPPLGVGGSGAARRWESLLAGRLECSDHKGRSGYPTVGRVEGHGFNIVSQVETR